MVSKLFGPSLNIGLPTKTVSQREQLSAFVISFNEEKNISRCLRSLDFCDEVLLIDSGSTDNTVQIAKDLGARVVQKDWPGYREQKEYGLGVVTHSWVLNVDSDEEVSAELRDQILEVLVQQKEGKSTLVGYNLNRLVYHLGRWWRRGGWYPEYRLRLFRKDKVSWGGVNPHEKVIPHGKVGKLKGDLFHFSYDDLTDQFKRLNHFSSIAAAEDFQAGKKSGLKKLIVNPVARFIRFYIVKRGLMEGYAGFIIALAESYYVFMKYAKLWELHFNLKNKERT